MDVMFDKKIVDQLKSQKRIAALDIFSPLYLKDSNDIINGGDIGNFKKLINYAGEAGFSLIRFCPIHDSGKHANPYKVLSTFSFSPVFLDITDIPGISLKFIKSHFLSCYANDHFFDYHCLYNLKIDLLRHSYSKLGKKIHDFVNFKNNISKYLKSYAVFKVFEQNSQNPWWEWSHDISQKPNIDLLYSKYEQQADFWLYTQWIMEIQWKGARQYALSRGIDFIIDKPIYPMPHSVDVWSNQDLFYLNDDGSPRYLAGSNVPGDPFGEQVWGSAVYKYQDKYEQIINLFIDNIKFLKKISNVIRIDHALGLIWKYYLYDPIKKTGRYQKAWGEKTLEVLDKKFSDMFFIAEDVGFIDVKLIDEPLLKYGIPGMRCIQWDHPRYREISKYPELSVAITSNHDTFSLVGWGKNNVFKIIEQVFSSKSLIASTALRDIINDVRRYNLPGTDIKENWSMRMQGNIEEVDWIKIKTIITKTSRLNHE